METGILSVYITFPNREEAIFVTGQLLEQRLIACANLHGPVLSLYRWEGSIKQEAEMITIAKTTDRQLGALIAAVKNLHSYELPCIIAHRVADGLPPFLQWIKDETSSLTA